MSQTRALSSFPEVDGRQGLLRNLVFSPDGTQAELTAKTRDGIAIRGTDAVTIVQNPSKN